jgi:hypothetical protein
MQRMGYTNIHFTCLDSIEVNNLRKDGYIITARQELLLPSMSLFTDVNVKIK